MASGKEIFSVSMSRVGPANVSTVNTQMLDVLLMVSHTFPDFSTNLLMMSGIKLHTCPLESRVTENSARSVTFCFNPLLQLSILFLLQVILIMIEPYL